MRSAADSAGQVEPRWQRELRRRGKASRLPIWAGIALLGAGFTTLALIVQPGADTDAEPELPSELAAEPDVYMEGSDITQYRADGSPHYRLRAQHVSYFARDAITELDAPQLELHNPDAPPWRVASTSGEMRIVPAVGRAIEDQTEGQTGETEEEITLRGAVRLRQDRADGFTEVSTDELVLYPERQFARADQPVMITTPASSATAAGLSADLRHGRMTLFSSQHQRVAIVVEPSLHQP